jgi:photosystem I P700 chlorophyll a apoprotein A2
MQLGLALAALGVTTLVVTYLCIKSICIFIYATEAALYTHHQYIAGFLMVGAFAHGAIFLRS